MYFEIDKYIDLIPLTPDNSVKIGDYINEARWNHHILPYGTLGLKIKGKSNCWGFSGDTKYNEEIIDDLKRDELKADWFRDCNLIFHEVDFSSPNTVHTYYKDLLKMKEKIRGKLFIYHTDANMVKDDLRIAEEGKRYILDNGKIKIKE